MYCMYVLSLIAVHGLDGHREDTWTAENGVLWLRDELPRIISNARVFTYGYDARTRGSTPLSCQTLYDHAMSLVAELSLERRTTKVTMPECQTLGETVAGLTLSLD